MAGGEFRLVFYTRDYEATVAFYRDGLELPIVGGWDRGPEDRGTLFQAAAGIIETLQAPGFSEMVHRAGTDLYQRS